MVHVILLDLLSIGFALASAWLWYQSSRTRLRRLRRHEEPDAADLNRLIVALNRAQILNARAALTTACAVVLAAIRFALDLV